MAKDVVSSLHTCRRTADLKVNSFDGIYEAGEITE